MRFGQEDLTQVMGIGSYGEVRVGPDGQPYQWVEGIDGLGNPIGFWRRLRRLGRRIRGFARRALPVVQQVASMIPHPAAQAVSTGIRTATPFLRQTGVLGYDGLGALYQAPNGSIYRVEGVAQNEELQGLGQDDLTQVMGIGRLGEVRTGPDGQPYQWVEGIDGLGNPIGFWKRLRRLGRRIRGFARRALPLVQQVASMIPHPAAQAVSTGLTTATPVLRRAGVLGLGALYQADDGAVYRVQGLAQDEELRGVGQDEELMGLTEEEELSGLAKDEEVQGLDEDEELQGLNEDEELRGLEQGYVRENGVSGLDAFVPDQPAGTRWFTSPSQPPEMWKPMW